MSQFGRLEALRIVSKDQVLGPGPRDIPSTDAIMQGHIEELKSQLAHRDGLIVKLQNELQNSRDDRMSSAEEVYF